MPRKQVGPKSFSITQELTRLDGEVKRLRREVERWQRAYQLLAESLATRDPAPRPRAIEGSWLSSASAPESALLSLPPMLPETVLAVIEETTKEGSPARARSLVYARTALAEGRSPTLIAVDLQVGEDLDI